ncbi:hypothetical protein DNTS_030878 [Danionella cerebrum]|uniref:Uncharacterized protein n=1 Tax=Danionella cerebrum TaxID=2873325 RepID=A0A553RMX3_9TELE|nr:hypothetical protein DNTS_030878 [Danionella translucida]
MKSLKQRLKKNESTEWGKYDERLMKAAESEDVEKLTATLKKGAIPTKLDPEGRSAFHVAASRGLIHSLNIFLESGVDVKAVDNLGKTALHLAAAGSHRLCVQKLLQSKCPVESIDLQGRTALHDAANAGCKASIRLLCDSGASVDAVDVDGRAPLLLAAKMGQPGACQMLVQCGARPVLRDKQNKTALILACESSSKEAVEILLKTKADVSAVDVFGHDACHYARLSQKPDLITLVQRALEMSTKAKETGSSQKTQQAKPPLIGIGWTKAGSVKKEKVSSEPLSKEHSTHSTEGIAAKPSHNLDLMAVPSQVRPEQLAPVSVEMAPGELDALKRELRDTRRRQEAAEVEVHRLGNALALRGQEYEALRRNSEQALHAAHSRAWELEEALGEVQRRMAGSENRVRQMQAHLMAVREHLVDELRVQLHEVKGQRDTVVAELSRMQKELGQSRREADKLKEHQSSLMQELSRISQELLCREEQINTLRSRLTETETTRVEMFCKESQTETCLNSEKSTMAEIYEAVVDLEEYISKDEHIDITTSLSDALKLAESKAGDALQKYQCSLEENQNLLRELQEQKTELDTIQEALQARFVPVALVEEKEKEIERLTLTIQEMEKSTTDTKEEGVQTEEHSSELQSHQVSSSTENIISDVTKTETEDAGFLVEQKEEGSVEVIISESISSCEASQSDSSLQTQVLNLQQQLQDSEKHYRHVLSMYRARLLSAAQGYMDEEARVALLQIAKMREERVC